MNVGELLSCSQQQKLGWEIFKSAVVVVAEQFWYSDLNWLFVDQDERLMWRIAEAENSQVVAELKQKISHLELQNEEIVTLDQVDNLNSIEDLINDDNSEDDEEETTSSGSAEKSMSCSTSTSSFRVDSASS